MTSIENRRDPRVEMALPVTVHTAAGQEPYETLDISYRGVFILCEEPLPLRKLVRFRTKITDDEELQMLGLVAHRVNKADALETGREAGMGIQLFSVGRQTRERWRSFVRERYEEDPEALEQITLRELPHIRVHLTTDEMKRQFLERDFPSGGIFYRTPDIHPPGTRVVCDVVHPETGQMLYLKAEVADVVEGPRRDRGMRVVFEQLSEATEDRMHRFDAGEELSEVSEFAGDGGEAPDDEGEHEDVE